VEDRQFSRRWPPTPGKPRNVRYTPSSRQPDTEQ
jgi:hypothetical protein